MENDLISRQAAIDAMNTWDKFGCDPDGRLVRFDDNKHYVPYVRYDDMVYVIKSLPSAQPEQRWIPCSERLPSKADHTDDMVLVSYRNGSVRFNTYMNGWAQGNPVAWMPLPEPYRGERTEGWMI